MTPFLFLDGSPAGKNEGNMDQSNNLNNNNNHSTTRACLQTIFSLKVSSPKLKRCTKTILFYSTEFFIYHQRITVYITDTDTMNMKDSCLPLILLLDIEGTTTSISFVKDVLFPYARNEMDPFLRMNWGDDNVQQIIQLVRIQSQDDAEKGLIPQQLPTPQMENDEEILIKSVVEYLLWQMEMDRKTTGLKALQGKIWAKGYADGILKSQVYGDVLKAFERWTKAGKKIYIYSSGSVEAQILLFRHSESGDLTQYISGYYDTTSGPKIEAGSYVNIANKIGAAPHDILFFTDISKEAYAAKEAGMQVGVLIRPGNAPLTSNESSELITLRSFDECIAE